MPGGRAVELIGEGAEEAVAVSKGGCGVQTEGAELLCELLGGDTGVCEELRGCGFITRLVLIEKLTHSAFG